MDRTSFLGYTIPSEIKNMIPVVSKLEPAFIKDILSMVVLYMKTKSINLVKKEDHTRLKKTTDEIHDKLSSQSTTQNIDPNLSSIVFTGSYYILKLAIKRRVNSQLFVTDITELKLPQSYITDISNIYNNQCKELTEKANNDKILFPQLGNFKWRVDVIISSSFTSRVLIPIILMEITDTNGTTKTFEVTLDNFHKLRYNVAKVLKDMDDLDQLPILNKFT
eukprot:gene1418-1790_t